MYTIAIYDRLYTAEWRQRSTLLKSKWQPFFLLIQKFGWWIMLFGCVKFHVSKCVVIVFMSINESFVTHSLFIQLWLTALSANDVMVTTLLKSIKSSSLVCPFNFCLLPDFSKKISAYRLVNLSERAGGWVGGCPASQTICVKVFFSCNNCFISQPIYFILTHIVP